MAVTDDRTPHRDYPLPHPRNRLQQDEPRLRAALTAIDADIQTLSDGDATRAASLAALSASDAAQAGRLDALEADLPPAATGIAGQVLAVAADGQSHGHAWRAPEPMADAFTLTPDLTTGEAAVVVSGYPDNFGPARVEVTGDLRVSVNGGGFVAGRTSASNGDTVTVKPAATLADGQTYSGSLSIGARDAAYAFTYVAAYLATPAFTAPADGAIGQPEQPMLVLSPYDVLPGDGLDALHPHQDTDWEVTLASDPGFAAPLWQSLGDPVNAVTVTLPAGLLQENTAYMARARTRSTTGLVSGWTTVGFMTGVFVPVISAIPSILRTIYGAPAISNGGRTMRCTGINTHQRTVSMHCLFGKMYFEVSIDAVGSTWIGVASDGASILSSWPGVSYVNSGHINVDNVNIAIVAAYTTGDVVSVAVDDNAGRVWFAKNGVWQNGDPAAGTGGTAGSARRALKYAFVYQYLLNEQVTVNFGHEAFAYPVPTGFTAGPAEYVAGTDVDAVFRSSLYTGAGAGKAHWHGIPYDSAADEVLLWIKNRSATGKSHTLIDTVRGIDKWLLTNSNSAETTTDGISSFSSGAFTTGSFTAGISDGEQQIFVWKKANNFFFLDTKAHTNGAASTVDLSSLGTVGMVFAKNTSAIQDWNVWHKDLTAGNNLVLNSTAAQTTTNAYLSVSGATLTISASAPSGTYAVYAWAHDASASGKIKCGVFTGVSEEQDIELGWTPQFLIIKANTAADWRLYDMTGGGIAYGDDAFLFPNATSTVSYEAALTPTPTGFRTGAALASVGTPYLYMAIRRGPTVNHEKPQQVYQAVSHTGTGTARDLAGIGFRADALMSHKTAATGNRGVLLSGTSRYNFNLANTIDVSHKYASKVFEVYPDGVRLAAAVENASSISYRLDAFKHCPGVYTSHLYRGTGTVQQIAHDLGVVPEMMRIKRLDNTGSWAVYHADLGAGGYLIGESTAAFYTADQTVWNGAAPTATSFTVGTSAGVNASGGWYLVELWASAAGMTKVGSVTTDASGNATVTCGFRPRFVLLKPTQQSGKWTVWTVEMGLSPSSAPAAEAMLYIDDTVAEVTGYDWLDTTADGFAVKGAWARVDTLAYLAFA